MAKDAIKVTGIITKIHSPVLYDVKIIENDITVQGMPSGKMRRFHIRILPGDKVDVEISTYDLTKGRITYRH